MKKKIYFTLDILTLIFGLTTVVWNIVYYILNGSLLSNVATVFGGLIFIFGIVGLITGNYRQKPTD